MHWWENINTLYQFCITIIILIFISIYTKEFIFILFLFIFFIIFINISKKRIKNKILSINRDINNKIIENFSLKIHNIKYLYLRNKVINTVTKDLHSKISDKITLSKNFEITNLYKNTINIRKFNKILNNNE